jgi:hypothetical protein
MDILQADEGTKFPLSRVLRERAVAFLSPLPFNTEVTYAALSEAIGLDVVGDKRGRNAVLQAGRLLLKEQHKKLVNVRRVGYRIVAPNEQVAVSQAEQKRARRWLKRALATVTHVALNDLTPEEVAKVLTEQARVGLSLSFQRRIGKQVSLPASEQLALPSGAKLVEMFKKRA